VKDPREVVKAGDIVKVKVMSVDVQRQRIALSMRMSDDANEIDDSGRAPRARKGGARNDHKTRSQSSPGEKGHGVSKARARGDSNSRTKGGSGASAGRGADRNRQQENQGQSALALSLKAALEKRQ